MTWRSTTCRTISFKFGQITDPIAPISLFSNDDIEYALELRDSWPLDQLARLAVDRLCILIRVAEAFRSHGLQGDNLIDSVNSRQGTKTYSNLKEFIPPQAKDFLHLGYCAVAAAGDSTDSLPFLLHSTREQPASANQSNITLKRETRSEEPESAGVAAGGILGQREKEADGDMEDVGGKLKLGVRRRLPPRRTSLGRTSTYIGAASTDDSEQEKPKVRPQCNTGGETGLIAEELVSHVLLRLAFLGNRVREDWLTQQEARLFSIKLCLVAAYQSKLDAERSLSWLDTHEGDKKRSDWAQAMLCLMRDLGFGTHFALTSTVQSNPIISGPFGAEWSHLVRYRRCEVRGGIVKAPLTACLHSLLSAKFSGVLRGSLVEHSRNHRRLEVWLSDTPGLKLLWRKLSQVDPLVLDSGRDSDADAEFERLTPQLFAICLRQSFPLCMVHLFLGCQKQRHLKHAGRLQLWLFLKDAGLSCDDQISLFRQLWGDGDKFDKEHCYTLRHMYGLEGKRQNKTSYSCSTILAGGNIGKPKAGELHGCPYRDLPENSLRTYLKEYKLSDDAVKDILKYKSDHQYEIACRKHFEYTHPGTGETGESDEVGITPMKFFSASRRWHASKSK